MTQSFPCESLCTPCWPLSFCLFPGQQGQATRTRLMRQRADHQFAHVACWYSGLCLVDFHKANHTGRYI